MISLGLASCENNPTIVPESWEMAFEPMGYEDSRS